ncbi:Striatin-interacting protein 2 [Blastocladiella emersonii ATCC 22665]|nr:Striatin-interacting protein 2 [Blastocladiella emersonii ATCC 22665]
MHINTSNTTGATLSGDDALLTHSPGELESPTADGPGDPLLGYQHTDCDAVDREIAAFFDLGDGDPPVAREIPFEERWTHLAWHEQRFELMRLLDLLEADEPAWREAARCLFYVAHGAYSRMADRDIWVLALKRSHNALAQVGLLTCLWPRVVAALSAWEAEIKLAQGSGNRTPPVSSGQSPTAAGAGPGSGQRTPVVSPAQADVTLLLGIFHAHVVACHSFAISVPLTLAEPNYLQHLIDLFLRVAETAKAHASVTKKILLVIWKLFLAQYGGRDRLREIKADLIKFHGLERGSSARVGLASPPAAAAAAQPASPDSIHFATKATDHDLRMACSELATRYPALALDPLLDAAGLRPTRQPRSSSSRHNRTVPATTPKRGFAARKKVASHDHLLLPHTNDDELDPPEPIREAVAILLAHHTPSLDTALLPLHDWDVPEKWAEHFDDLEHTFYAPVLPKLPALVVALLRVILVYQPLPAYYPSAPQHGHPAQHQQHGPGFRGPTVLPTMQIARREREILATAAAATLVLVLRHVRLAHPLMGEYVGQLLVDSNALVLILKTLSMDDYNAYLHAPAVPDMGEPAFLRDLLKPNPGFTHRNAHLLVDLTHLAYLLVKNKPHRVHALYNSKAFNVMKRLLPLSSIEILRRALKAIKIQMPFLSRKWRQGNIQIISLIYHHLTPKLVDDYLMTSDAETEGAEGRRQEDAMRHVVHAFHEARFPDSYTAAPGAGAGGAGGSPPGSPRPGSSGTSTPLSSPSSPRAGLSRVGSADGRYFHEHHPGLPGLGYMEVSWLYSHPLMELDMAPLSLDGDGDDGHDVAEGSGGILEEWRDEYEEQMSVDEWWKS